MSTRNPSTTESLKSQMTSRGTTARYRHLLLVTLMAWSAWSGMTFADVQTDEKSDVPVQIRLGTSMGDIVVELNVQKAPQTCKNFLSYVEKGFYDDTLFHRVIADFMIQGGGFNRQMKKKQTGAPIRNEWRNGLKNKRGTIAMARLGGQPDSATCQFFINLQDNPGLDQPRDGAGYAVFGHVVQGLAVVDQIGAATTTQRGRYRDVPTEPIILEKVTRIDSAEQESSSDEHRSSAR